MHITFLEKELIYTGTKKDLRKVVTEISEILNQYHNNNLFTYSARVPWKDAHKSALHITKMNLLQNLQS